MAPSRSSRPSSAKPENVTVVFKYGSRRLLVPTPSDHSSAVELVKKHIRGIPANRIRFLAKVEDFEDEVEITSDAWHLVAKDIRTFTVVDSKDQEDSDCEGDTEIVAQVQSASSETKPIVLSQQAPPIPNSGVAGHTRISVNVKFYEQQVNFRVLPSTKLRRLFEALTRAIGLPHKDLRFRYRHKPLDPSQTLADYEMEDDDVIIVTLDQVGGKPVIYLYPPNALDVDVRLFLVPQWTFSAIYPVVDIKQTQEAGRIGQSVEWNVFVDPNGTLRDKTTHTEASYLFWEAETQPIPNALDSPPPSRAASPPLDSKSRLQVDKTFIPGQSRCTPENSVLVDIDAIPGYLDKSLLALGLHTEARTSFITYWLPSLLKHKFIALRFLPQSIYESAAPLNISPTPDVVTRVFMLFQGIAPQTVEGLWDVARQRAGTNTIPMWKAIVGIDEVRQKDQSLFRVLEWGGMEVY